MDEKFLYDELSQYAEDTEYTELQTMIDDWTNIFGYSVENLKLIYEYYVRDHWIEIDSIEQNFYN